MRYRCCAFPPTAIPSVVRTVPYLTPHATRRFSFYDGPPFATGLPHYGHILAGTIKVCDGIPP